MSSDAKLQFNFKTPNQSLINLYAQDEQEAQEQLEVLGRLIKDVGEIEALLGAIERVNAVTQPAPQGASVPAYQQQAQRPAGDSPICNHGQMEFKEGVSKSSGKPYKGWFCPSSDRNDQCKPQFIR